MNPLTQVKNTQKIIARELASGISEGGSWHAKYKDSAYVYVGGLPYTLTEGDVLAVFAQYGEIVDVNLVRDKATGKPKGFAFLAYEDQRSTVLAVDNLNGARVVDRIIKVDHVGDYKRKLEEDEEEKQQKREERGVCYAFQRGECNRGDDCKFSHDEQRNANTGWGDGGAGRGNGGTSWKHDQFDGSMKEAGRRMNMVSSTKRNDTSIDEKPRGVCYAFQRGECNRGDNCKFAHDEQKSMNSGRGGGGAGWKPDQFDKSMKDAGRRMNMGNDSPERNRTGNDKSMKPPDDRRRKDDGQRRRDADRGREDGEKRDAYLEDRRRDDGQRRRDGDRDDRRRTRDGDDRDDKRRTRDGDDRDDERRVRRSDNREGSYERRDPETSSFEGEEGGRRENRMSDRRSRDDEKRDVRKETERSDLRDGRRDYERSVRSRR